MQMESLITGYQYFLVQFVNEFPIIVQNPFKINFIEKFMKE